MTLIELLIAMTIMAIAVIPLVASLDYSRKATASTEKRGVDSAIGQAEMERIAAMKYTDVGTTSMPTASGSGDPKDPLNYVQGTSYAYDWTSPSTVEPLVTGGTLAPTSTWQDGRLGGNVYRFVTWVDDPCPVCTGTQDYKRVTVAVTVTTGPLRVSPFLATTFVRRP